MQNNSLRAHRKANNPGFNKQKKLKWNFLNRKTDDETIFLGISNSLQILWSFLAFPFKSTSIDYWNCVRFQQQKLQRQ